MAEVGDVQTDDKFHDSSTPLNGKTDSFDRIASEDELNNIRSLIQLTKEHIDDLNSRFAGFQHPPSLYLKEYTELTGKLHLFEAKEQEILDLLTSKSCEDDPQNSETGYPDSGILLPTSHALMFPTNSGPYCEDFGQDCQPNFPLHNTTSNGIGSGYFGASNNEEPPRSTPQSPLRSVVRAYLPNQQRTTVHVQPGRTLRHALAKALTLRKLSPEVCVVYKAHPKMNLSWDTDIALLEGDEIVVEVMEKFPLTTSISHNFIRRTFFSLAFCDNCRRLLFHGFLCRTCGYRFHQRCSVGVPTLCQQDHRIITSNLYQHLLASSYQNPAGILATSSPLCDNDGGSGSPHYPMRPHHGSHYHTHITSGPSLVPGIHPNPPLIPRSAPTPLAPRDRSSSAPNVCCNLVNSTNPLEAASIVGRIVGRGFNPASPGQSKEECSAAFSVPLTHYLVS